MLVGLDVIGGCLTEVNVTSPTCFQEITQQMGFDVAAMFVDALEAVGGERRLSATTRRLLRTMMWFYGHSVAAGCGKHIQHHHPGQDQAHAHQTGGVDGLAVQPPGGQCDQHDAQPRPHGVGDAHRNGLSTSERQ